MFRLCVTFLAVLLLVGCSSGYISPRSIETDIHVREVPLPPRVLHPGDKLQLAFMTDIARNSREEYRLDNLDEIDINVRDRIDLSGVFVVVPDGWLYAPQLKPIRVKNMTIRELQQTLADEYGKTLNNPQVQVGLRRYNRNVETFISGLAQASDAGPTFETDINRDGTAIFPLIGKVEMEGMTVAEATEALLKHYKEALPAIQLTVRLLEGQNSLVTVLGEVQSPVSFPVYSSVSLAEAIGAAEGWTREATISHVIVIQPRGDRYHVAQYDLQDRILEASQVKLVGGDLVYVPRSVPADINILVDQLIRRNIPINANLGYNFSRVDN